MNLERFKIFYGQMGVMIIMNVISHSKLSTLHTITKCSFYNTMYFDHYFIYHKATFCGKNLPW